MQADCSAQAEVEACISRYSKRQKSKKSSYITYFVDHCISKTTLHISGSPNLPHHDVHSSCDLKPRNVCVCRMSSHFHTFSLWSTSWTGTVGTAGAETSSPFSSWAEGISCELPQTQEEDLAAGKVLEYLWLLNTPQAHWTAHGFFRKKYLKLLPPAP